MIGIPLNLGSLTGTFVITEDNGKKLTLGKGDSWFISRGTKAKFTTPTYGIAFKAANRWIMPKASKL